MSGTSESVFTCNGASNHSTQEREIHDYYATEPRAGELLLEQEKFKPYIWECACGAGHLAEVFKAHGYKVYATDLVNRGFGLYGVDFLTVQPEQCNLSQIDIVTNPPYSKAKEFVQHALDLLPNGGKVAMFLKLTFLESKSRRELFDVTPHIVYTFHPRVCNARKMAISASIQKA